MVQQKKFSREKERKESRVTERRWKGWRREAVGIRGVEEVGGQRGGGGVGEERRRCG